MGEFNIVTSEQKIQEAQEARDKLQILIARALAVVLGRMPGNFLDIRESLEDETQALETLIHAHPIMEQGGPL